MSRALAQMQTDDGTVMFDIDDADMVRVRPEHVSRRGQMIVAELDESLEQVLPSVRPTAQAVLNTFSAIGPNHVLIEFGVRLDVSAGAVIAKTGIEAHFTVKLDWDPKSA